MRRLVAFTSSLLEYSLHVRGQTTLSLQGCEEVSACLRESKPLPERAVREEFLSEALEAHLVQPDCVATIQGPAVSHGIWAD